MQLRIMTPRQIVLDTGVRRIIGQGSQGAFGLWASHIDCVSDLVPGVLRYQPICGPLRYAGLAAGILVKIGPVVTITTRQALLGDDPAVLAHRIRAEIRAAQDAEELERAALARLEDEMQRQFRTLDHVVC